MTPLMLPCQRSGIICSASFRAHTTGTLSKPPSHITWVTPIRRSPWTLRRDVFAGVGGESYLGGNVAICKISQNATERKNKFFPLGVFGKAGRRRLCVRATSGAPASPEADKRTLWWQAIKLPIFTVSLVPLMVGAAAAYLETGVFAARLFWAFAVAGVFVIAWLNLSNDAYDSETTVDLTKAESVVNLTGSRNGVLNIARAFLVSGGGLLAYAVASAGDVRAGYMLAAAVVIGHVYQAPPFRLSYKGLGEPLCFIAFGPLATNAFYFAQAASALAHPHVLTPVVVGAGVLVGITTSVILFCSHFHQVEGDIAAGKRSPVVKLGRPLAAKVLRAPVIGLHVLHVAFVAAGWLPWTCLVAAAVTLPLALQMEQFVTNNHLKGMKVAPAKIYATKWHAAHGLALSIALVCARWYL
eukprot:CAMPEP_0118926146 /NCGR_PEP_ID=MMETSP1169-20130426/3916_1 /TAXON_ID=36882 /ORGANISM="Pyramimonas obovata, Strain CCMP722" /LENGTH=412 /DNA_ID=CAMNT_0006867643 /DNA_START=345 /DNA_END=1583 /DNA_ORIENTATION=-